jgi:transposase
LKGARPVRTGGRRKRTCATGTSPAAYRCFVVLEAAGLKVQLVNARAVKNAPGRAKTGKKDAVWLAKLTEKGLLQPSFIPPYEIRRLRELTRLRTSLVHDKSRYWARLEKLLLRHEALLLSDGGERPSISLPS